MEIVNPNFESISLKENPPNADAHPKECYVNIGLKEKRREVTKEVIENKILIYFKLNFQEFENYRQTAFCCQKWKEERN
jgi:hypothetical protein